jgi:hypothetical protein
MITFPAVQFWIDGTPEQFARWLERETGDWSTASLVADLQMDPFAAAFDSFKADADLSSANAGWGLDARGKNGSQAPEQTRGRFTFRLEPHGRNGERVRVTFRESRPFEPCEEDGLEPADGSRLARVVEIVEGLAASRLDELFAKIERDWPETAGKIVAVWQAKAEEPQPNAAWRTIPAWDTLQQGGAIPESDAGSDKAVSGPDAAAPTSTVPKWWPRGAKLLRWKAKYPNVARAYRELGTIRDVAVQLRMDRETVSHILEWGRRSPEAHERK